MLLKDRILDSGTCELVTAGNTKQALKNVDKKLKKSPKNVGLLVSAPRPVSAVPRINQTASTDHQSRHPFRSSRLRGMSPTLHTAFHSITSHNRRLEPLHTCIHSPPATSSCSKRRRDSLAECAEGVVRKESTRPGRGLGRLLDSKFTMGVSWQGVKIANSQGSLCSVG